MLKTLVNILGGFPGIGPALKAMYIGSLVKDLVKKVEGSEADPELREKKGEELDGALSEEANELFDEAVGPFIKENNIPEMIVNPAKEKAIEELVATLRKKVLK